MTNIRYILGRSMDTAPITQRHARPAAPRLASGRAISAVNDRKIKKPKSLTLLALEKIREGITRGEYALGAPLYEKLLAGEFGISKTPVREALVQLQREGLVVVQPHSGTFVFELADGEVSELCELRLILETNAVQLAMRRQRGRLTA